MNKSRGFKLGLIAVTMLIVLGLVVAATFFTGVWGQTVSANAASPNDATATAASISKLTANEAEATATPGAKQNVQQYFAGFHQDLASKLGVSESQLDTAFSGAVSDTLDKLVKDGVITQQQADKIKQATSSGFTVDSITAIASSGKEGSNDGLQPDLNQILGAVAPVLGMSQTDLQNQLRAGQSIAQVAQAKNVDAQKVKDAIQSNIQSQLAKAVSSGKISQQQASDLQNQISNMVAKIFNATALVGDANTSADSFANPKALLLPALDEVAKLLNISSPDLLNQLQSGKAMTDIAQAHGVDAQKVQQTILDSGKAQLNAAVSAGKLTQADADKAYQAFTSFVANFMTYRNSK